MADIRNYEEEKEKRRKREGNYQDKIYRYKMKNFYRVLLALVAVGAVIMLIYTQYQRHVYTGYDVLSSVDRAGYAGTIDRMSLPGL